MEKSDQKNIKDIRTAIVKKRKGGQCVIRENGAINTPFLPLAQPTEYYRKEGGGEYILFFIKRKGKTSNLLGLYKPKTLQVERIPINKDFNKENK